MKSAQTIQTQALKKTTLLNQSIKAGIIATVVITAALPLTTLIAAEATVSQQQTFQIPAGPLSQSLNQFASQAGITLSFDPDLVRGQQTETLSGQYSVEQGLNKLLAGKSLQIIVLNQNSYRVEAAEDTSDGVVLPRVNVSAAAYSESGLGPVSGYVAKQSITATKSDIPLIETPQSVSIVTADQITIQNAESLTQALKYSASISPMGGDHTTSDTIVIRGFNVGASPTYLNGSKLARNSFSAVIEPYTMERLEVLKGPASVLYGNAAPGGIINMVTKQPQTETLRELKVQAGSFDRKQLAGDFAGALNEDGSLSYRLTGLVRRSDTMTDYVPDDREFLQGSVRWEPNDETNLTLLANYQNNETGYVYGLPAEGTVIDNINGDIDRDRFIGEPDFDKFDAQNHTLGYLLRHDINNQMTFRQNFLHYDGKTDWNYVTAGAVDASQQLLSRGATARADENSSWSIDNQLEIKWDLGASQHTSLMGLDYTEQSFDRLQYSGSVADLNLFNPVYGSVVTLSNTPAGHGKQDSKQLGLYVQEHIKFDDRWVVMLGGRYDKIEADSKNKLTNITTEDYNDDAFTGRAGLVYLFDNGFAPYISYAESFEAVSGQDFSGSAFKPTEGEQYEIGVRYQPEGQDLSITASVYKLTQKNVITTDLDNPGFSIQEGEVESKGFELEARANLTNNLNLIASYGYIDNAVTESNSGTEGNRYGGVPRHMASLWADYKFRESIPGLGLGAGARYYGRSYNLANTYEAPGFTVVDAVVNYSLTPEWSLALNINNVFDEEYATCSYACFYGVERSAVATATYNW